MRMTIERLADVATILAGLGALLVGAAVVSGRSTPPVPIRQAGGYFEDWPEYAREGHRVGPPDAEVTIVEFGDYECPFCRQAEPHLQAILREHGEDVALVYRHLPLPTHQYAYSAARAAECAGEQGAFWPFHEFLYEEANWMNGAAREVFLDLAARAEISDQDAFADCIDRDEPVTSIARDQSTAVALGFTGTPTFLVNGLKYIGVIDSLQFDAIFDEARGR